MRRRILAYCLAGVFGALLWTSETEACCHKKKCADPCAAPAPCAKPHFNLFKCFHKHKKCAEETVCATPCAPCEAAPAPVAASPQAAPSMQGPPPAPSKQAPTS
ncbi:MAG TPA: hypothetical protein VGZ22_12830 [Isosphaeraceae bacterium]|jgi:hypothetical protein|nr:hypothetical protein [Isosphaeraceae bacterium]